MRGVAYLILKDWDARGAGEDLRSLVVGLNQTMAEIEQARIIVLPPPPIQGIGNAAGFAMQVELRDGNADFAKLQAHHQCRGRQRADPERAATGEFAVPFRWFRNST